MKNFRRNLAQQTVLAALLAARVAAATVVLTPTKDNTIFGPTDKSDGLGDEFFAGRSGHGDVMRTLLTFDIAGALPTGALINSATLSLTVTTPQSHASTLNVFTLLADWGQGQSSALRGGAIGATATTNDATWNMRFFNVPGTAWATPGGDFAAAARATQFITASTVTAAFSSADLMADVQTWLDNPSANFGWMLRAQDEVSTGIAIRFASREAAAGRPALMIDYTVAAIPEPGAVALLASAGSLVVAIWRRRVGFVGPSREYASRVPGGAARPPSERVERWASTHRAWAGSGTPPEA